MLKKNKWKKEEANFIDSLGSIYVVMFALGIIILFACYTKIIETVARIDSTCMTYLGVIEQNGYLPTDYEAALKNDLAYLGVVPSTIDLTGSDVEAKGQVTYGNIVKLQIKLDIKNPIYYIFSDNVNSKSWLKLSGILPNLHYEPAPYTSTSKW